MKTAGYPVFRDLTGPFQDLNRIGIEKGSLGERPVKAGREPDRKLVCYHMEHDYRFQTEIDLFWVVSRITDR
ncbi:MAG: hypothetical protein V3V52_11460 [Candidatus Adiutricales bacterium]